MSTENTANQTTQRVCVRVGARAAETVQGRADDVWSDCVVSFISNSSKKRIKKRLSVFNPLD